MSAPEIILYICHNSLGAGDSIRALEDLATTAAGGRRVAVRETPCSGKTDVNYLLRAFEGGARGVGIVTCPPGACRLAEGNVRAQLRARHVAGLLDEIGLGGRRLVVLHGAAGESGGDLPARVREAAAYLAALPENPLGLAVEPARTESR